MAANAASLTSLNLRAQGGGIALLALAGCSILAGCGMGTSSTVAKATGIQAPVLGAISGRVHGGQQPITLASIYLYAVAQNGYGQAATSLLAGPGVATDGNGHGYVSTNTMGNFSISGDYTCPSGTSLVYILSAGGNPGMTTGTNNQAAMLGVALGNCATLKQNASTTYINIDEVTTVALAYALSGFMTSATHVGASSTNLAGITNAFATANLLANAATGTAPLLTPAGNGAVPQAELNTLANALSPCVNSDGTVSGPESPTACYKLFAAARVGNVTPGDTLQAILNVAQNPANNVGAVAMVATADAPFQPTLNSAPNDWTVGITYTGGGIGTPQGLAIDAGGNAWVANAGNSVAELGAGSGAALSGASGFGAVGLDAPVSVAIDTTGQVWVANCGNACSGSGHASSVTVLAANGASSSNYTSSGFNAAYAVALSGANQVWVANAAGSSLTQLNSAGSTVIAQDLAANLIYPTSVAVDANGNALTVSPADNAVVEFTAAGLADAVDGYQGSALSYPFALAVDHSDQLWVANHGANSVTVLSGGTPSAASPITGGGLTTPVAIALDGAGNAWVANTSNTLSEISNGGVVESPATGLRGDLVYPNAVAVDGSGNVWVSSCGSYCEPGSQSSGSVMELVGAAVPVVTPLAIGAANHQLATLP
jgi:hypothetical protein